MIRNNIQFVIKYFKFDYSFLAYVVICLIIVLI